MSDWREHILKEFTPGVQPITVVADPDGLLTEPRLSQALTEQGFKLLLFEDCPIQFSCAGHERCGGVRPTRRCQLVSSLC